VLQVLHWGIAAGDYQAKPDFALRLLSVAEHELQTGLDFAVGVSP